jgi:hypothetical protein
LTLLDQPGLVLGSERRVVGEYQCRAALTKLDDPASETPAIFRPSLESLLGFLRQAR